jgi:hypothetical protein
MRTFAWQSSINPFHASFGMGGELLFMRGHVLTVSVSIRGSKTVNTAAASEKKVCATLLPQPIV